MTEFTQEHADKIDAIHADIQALKAMVEDFMPQAEQALTSGPLAMIAGSLFKRP